MRDVRLVAQSGERKPPSAFDLDAKREVERELDARAFAPPAGGPAGLPAGFDPATERTSAPSPLQTQPSDASSMASSGTPATTKTAAKTNASASTASADASADAAKAAAKAAKEARKAAHLAEMEKKGAAAAPKKQLTRAERRAQQEAQKAAKAAKNEGGGDGAGVGAGTPSKKAAAGSSAGDLQKVAAAAGDEASVSSLSSTKEVVGNPARQAQRVERAREAKASAKAKSKHAGGRLSDHFSHLRPFEKPRGGFADARSDVVYARPPRGSANFSVEKQTEHTEHPAVTRLARLYADGTITGGRARCAALLHTLKKVVESFEVPPDETYAHALTARVNAVVQHIQSARPMSVSMGNAVKSLKTHLARMSEEHASARGDAAPVASGNVDHASDFESRRKTMAHLEYFEVEKIEKAGRSIAEHGANEISDGDVVATHGLSHHCFEILKEAKRRGVRFGVAVIDSRPNLEGQTQLRRLRAVGVECTYCQLTGLDHVLRKGKVTKVLLGAAAVLANGAVVSRCGAAVVAASAVEYKIPVLVAAETVKFHERVQLDAVAHNELGDPDLVAFGAAVGLETDGIGSGHARDNAGGDKNKNGEQTADPSSVLPSAADAGGATSASAGAFASPLAGWRSHERLSVLNLKYDSTPASCVRSIVCESGAVAPTDVPSFLR
jgi:translation initiation factor eIF-2B subunit delta